MIKPLAMIYYERLMPGSRLVNRLHDLGYRVITVEDAALLIKRAEEEKALVLVTDLVARRINICSIIKDLKSREQTSHIPVIGFAGEKDKKLHNEAVSAGASIVAFDEGVIPQLPHLLEQALHID